ncbi:hypothetical protein, partial [Candidatus Methylomirabilis sp.]|uniref:hypothetical protein n=1 Tax=Candidatus Methylomirabilis sp. TaxID=2032687 RepID=UPI003C78AD6F
PPLLHPWYIMIGSFFQNLPGFAGRVRSTRVIASDQRECGNPTRSVVASRRRSNLFSRDSFGSLAITREWGFPGNDAP